MFAPTTLEIQVRAAAVNILKSIYKCRFKILNISRIVTKKPSGSFMEIEYKVFPRDIGIYVATLCFTYEDGYLDIAFNDNTFDHSGYRFYDEAIIDSKIRYELNRYKFGKDN